MFIAFVIILLIIWFGVFKCQPKAFIKSLICTVLIYLVAIIMWSLGLMPWF